jgi:hypothetical protein
MAVLFPPSIKNRSFLYPDVECALCQTTERETTEHIMFRCPSVHTQRQKLHDSCPSMIQKTHPRVPSVEIKTRWYSKVLPAISASSKNLKLHSAGQLPRSFGQWLNRLADSKQAEKLGRKLHLSLITGYHNLWIARCNIIKSNHLLLRDRLRLFDTPKPLHQMIEDDYAQYAISLRTHRQALQHPDQCRIRSEATSRRTWTASAQSSPNGLNSKPAHNNHPNAKLQNVSNSDLATNQNRTSSHPRIRTSESNTSKD